MGVIHHDFFEVWPLLVTAYAETGDWERAAQRVLGYRREYGARLPFPTALLRRIRPSFVMVPSHWNAKFVEQKAPTFVLHPFLADIPRSRRRLKKVDVTMVNPLAKKGGLAMASIITDNRHGWRFRILDGGWGDKSWFHELILEARLLAPERIDVVDYLPDITDAYRSTRVLIFPSRQEGYGMVAAEALQAGVPTIVSDFPAIAEAVGNAARRVPYFATADAWIRTIRGVLKDTSPWRARARARRRFLEERQRTELDEFVAFLRAL
jgi:glycosyltransferase involved in cell wall biosynthesis